jgi:mono/diheme cytochrome c family protein
MRTLVIVLALAVAITLPAAAQEKPVELKKAPGLDQVEANCSGCHSLDYIVMNSPFPNAALWDAEVTKMIKAFGAPIGDADAKIIADYLKKNYGSCAAPEKSAAAAALVSSLSVLMFSPRSRRAGTAAGTLSES